MVGAVRRMVTAIGFVLIAFSGTAAHAETTGQQRVVERARLALDAFLDDPNFKEMRIYVQNAYGVLIVPEMLRAGFFFGAEHGIGVLLVRDTTTGEWGQPAFYELYGGSFGLQFGGQSSDVVFTIMNEDAVDTLLNADVRMKFGADAGLAVGRLGGRIGAGTTTHLGEDIYVFAKSKGLYGGFTLESALVVPKDDWNHAYYGEPVRPEEIVRRNRVVASNDVAGLQQALTRF